MSKGTIVGNQNVADAVSIAGTQGAIALSTTAVPVRVGAANATRKLVTVYNNSQTAIYWGWNDSVTTVNGTPIEGYTLMTFAVSKNINVYIIAGSGPIDVRVTEVI